MNSRTIALILGILLVLALVYIGFTSVPEASDMQNSATTTPAAATTTTDDTTGTAAVTVTTTTVTATYDNATSDDIRLETPEPGATTGSSFAVSGQARGPWYFEASFPVRILDEDGNTLATAVAQAQSDWMTEGFVPFTAQVTVPSSYHGTATIVLAKDNPSGLPDNDASLSVPITIR